MPFSDAWGKQRVRDHIVRLNAAQEIHSVTDLACGSGSYSDLLRTHIGSYWIGVEIWAPYIEQFNLGSMYNQVIVCDMRYLRDEFLNSNLILCGDVLEHMSHGDSSNMIMNMIFDSEPDAIVVLCVPMLHLEQGPFQGNPFEIHRMENHWTESDMDATVDALVRQARFPVEVDKLIGDVIGYWVVRKGKYATTDSEL